MIVRNTDAKVGTAFFIAFLFFFFGCLIYFYGKWTGKSKKRRIRRAKTLD